MPYNTTYAHVEARKSETKDGKDLATGLRYKHEKNQEK